MSTLVPSLGTLREQVVAFLVHEAELMDQGRHDDWLALWSPEGIYWVPCNEDDYDPRQHVSIIYDDHARLEERCFRLNSESAHSQLDFLDLGSEIAARSPLQHRAAQRAPH